MCCSYNQNKMLIRHKPIPRNSPLIPLSEPKVQEQFDDSNDYASYFTKTLNPELPIKNILTSEKEGKLSISPQPSNDHSFSSQINEPFLSKQLPQRMGQSEAELVFSPKNQIYKNRVWNNEGPYQISSKPQLNSRFPTFNSYSPQLTKNAYLSGQYQANFHQLSINNNFYLQSKEDQQQQGIKNDHLNKLSRNIEVYRTLQKFKSLKIQNNHEGPLKKMHKKYTFDSPKQNFGSPEPQRNYQEQRQLQKKQRKLQPIHGNKVKSNISHQNLLERKRKMLPEDQSEQQNPFYLRKNNSKSFSLRKSSQQQMIPTFKIQSSVHLTSKKIKDNSLSNRAIVEGQPIKIQISYRISLARLKEICSLQSLQNYNIIMKIPQIFAYPLFSGSQSQEQLFQKADETLRHLQIAKKDISIKKYSNCILIVSGLIGVVWHFNGKVYLGGWKNRVLDEGAKQGLGLEWAPKRYVYYGQFSKNRRQGVGMMKTCENQIVAGMWRDNHFIRSLSFSERKSSNRIDKVSFS